MCKIKRVLLESAGYRVIEAENVRNAVEVAIRERPRLILMNYLMPEMDGLTATAIIRQHREVRHMSTIMNSALLITSSTCTQPQSPIEGF